MIIEHNDDPAIQYIKDKGYASYSSMKNVRDCVVPSFSQSIHFDLGTELHSRWMEKTLIRTYPDHEPMLKGMEKSLNKNKIATSLLKGASVEVEFLQDYKGLTVKGYIDIKNLPRLGDLKTFGHADEKKFIESMDFLQPALYLAVEPKAKHFYYIGVSKVMPYKVVTFNVMDYPERLKAAQKELDNLVSYIVKRLKK